MLFEDNPNVDLMSYPHPVDERIGHCVAARRAKNFRDLFLKPVPAPLFVHGEFGLPPVLSENYL